MSRVALVRHGRPTATWGSGDPDPGLDAAGRAQAAEAAGALDELFGGPVALVTSPLRRARETAAAIAAAWGTEALVDPAVGEVPAPVSGDGERARWLRGFLGGRWRDAPAPLRAWRDAVVARVAAHGAVGDAVVVSHFVAICAVVGAATGDDRVACFWPDHCSVTVVAVEDGGLAVVSLGRSARTVVR